MTIANTTILLKKSGVPGNVPSSLTYGELGINYHDGKLFYLNSNNIVSQFITGSNVANTNSFSTINVNSSLILATSPTDILSIVPGNNITISTNTTTKTITIDSTSGGNPFDQSLNTTDNVAFNQVRTENIIGNNGHLLLTADTNNPQYTLEVYNSIDSDTHIRPTDPTLGVALGFGFGQGSHVRVQGTSQGNNVVISAFDPGTSSIAEWTFANDGTLTLPQNSAGDAVVYSTSPLELYSNVGGGTDAVKIRVKGDAGDSSWQFKSNGNVLFPDGSVQTTAYTGSIGVNPFNQSLNTTDNVTFNSVTVTSNIAVGNISIGNFSGNDNYIQGGFTTGNTIVTAVPANQLKLYGLETAENPYGYPVTMFDDALIFAGYGNEVNSTTNGFANDMAIVADRGNMTLASNTSNVYIISNYQGTGSFGPYNIVDGNNYTDHKELYVAVSDNPLLGSEVGVGDLVGDGSQPYTQIIAPLTNDGTNWTIKFAPDAPSYSSILLFLVGKKYWNFDANGVIHLPVGGDIVNANGLSVLGGSGSGIDGFARDVANAAYSQANLTNILTQSSYDQANTGTLLAQDAYNFANTIASSSGHSTITDDNTTNNVLYINFTESTSGVLTDIKTSSEKLTYNPYSGTIGVNSINLTANTNMAASGVNLSSLSQVTIDSLPANLYRSAFYQVQISSGLEFHILNLNVVHNDFNVFVNTFGDTYSLETLGSFTASIVDGLLNVQFTPVYSSTTVSFVRNAIAKMGVEVPSGSLGFVGDPVTIFFDAGYDADPVGTQQDYGTVG